MTHDVCLGFLVEVSLGIFERVALGHGYQGLICLEKSIFAAFLLGALLGVYLFGTVMSGCL